MQLIDALSECLYREWGDTEEVDFILEAVREYMELGHYPEERKEQEAKINSVMKVFDQMLEKLLPERGAK